MSGLLYIIDSYNVKGIETYDTSEKDIHTKSS
jgi:hypothetical protein